MTRTLTLAACIVILAASLAGCSTPSAPATHIRIDFGADQSAIVGTVPFDAAARPADSAYQRLGLNHSAYTAYDQLVQWAAATGTSLHIQTFSWGDCLGRIDGIPAIPSCDANATAYWSLNVNGKDAMEGMATVVLHAGDRVTWTLTAIEGTPDATGSASGNDGGDDPATPGSDEPAAPKRGHVAISSPERVETMDGVVEVNGTATAGAKLSFAVQANAPITDKGQLSRDGDAWGLRIELPTGVAAATFTFTVDDGLASKSSVTRVVRLGQAVFQVDYKGIEPSRDETIWYDWTNHTSAPLYADKDVAHPDYYTVHDFMAAWSEQTGVVIVMSYYDGVGYFVNSIDGVGTPGTVGDTTGAGPWCYNLNGESAQLGISQQELKAGDVVEWVLGCA